MPDPSPFLRRADPVATFRAEASRDASSIAHDGDLVYQVRHLDSEGGPLAEVQFGNGEWLLADPVRDLDPPMPPHRATY